MSRKTYPYVAYDRSIINSFQSFANNHNTFSCKKGTLFMLFFLITLFSFGQPPVYFPSGIGSSDQNNSNVNHKDGTNLQDLKRSVGFIFGSNGLICSCTLMNSATQNKKPYILAAEHCFDNIVVENTYDSYLSFDFEIENAERSGTPQVDSKISRIYPIKIKPLLLDAASDTALLELQAGYDDQLLQYAYAAGWDNTLPDAIWSNISHPRGDHKKVFINPEYNFFLQLEMRTSSVLEGIKECFYLTAGVWNDNETNPESGSSGSGFFSKNNLLKAIYSNGEGKGISLRDLSTVISNSWYQADTALPSLSKYLDPYTTWLNSIPGGYINGLQPVDNGFTLTVDSNTPLFTPSTVPGDDKLLDENVVWLMPSIIFHNLNPDTTTLTWQKIAGIKAENCGNSDVVLSVSHLKRASDLAPYEKSLIYGVHANKDSPITTDSPVEFGFKGEGWDCANSGNFLPCNEIDVDQSSLTSSSSVKRAYWTAVIDELKKNNNFDEGISQTKIPIQIKLENRGSEAVTIQAVAYPGDVPKNALQLFKPNEVLSKFKSNKYKESRGIKSNELYINQVADLGPVEIIKKLETGDNGGYLNLANPNFYFDQLWSSYFQNDILIETEMTLKVDIVSTLATYPLYYKIWIDFLPDVDTNNYYNFVEDSTSHQIEEVGSGTIEGGNSFTKTFTFPDNETLGINPGEFKLFRMRIAVSTQNNMTQDGVYEKGEVEDYLVKLYVPTAADVIRLDAIIAIPTRSGEETAENGDTCGVSNAEPTRRLASASAPVNVGDATSPYSCNTFECDEITYPDCQTTALSSTSAPEGSYAICFEGANDFIALDTTGNILHDAIATRTVSFWLNTTDDTGMEIVYDEGGSTDGGMGIEIDNTTQKLIVGVSNGTTLETIEADAPETDSWVHVVAIFDNGALSLYVNGTLSALNSSVGLITIPEHADEAGFGATNGTNIFGGTSKSYKGCADDILIFDRVLNPSEITTLYLAGSPGPAAKGASNNKQDQIQTTTPDRDLVLYPNPSNGDSINLITEVKQSGTVKIEIIDLLGKVVYEKTFNNVDAGFQNVSISGINLPSASYIVRVTNGRNVQTGRLAVEN